MKANLNERITDPRISEERIVAKALELLAMQERDGVGLKANSRFGKGFPIRITAAIVIHSLSLGLTSSLRTARSREVTDHVNNVLARNFRLDSVVRGPGNVYFYSI